MAITFVQSTSGGANNVSAASVGLTLTVTAGNTLLLIGASWPSVPNISDTQGNVWTTDLTNKRPAGSDFNVFASARAKASGSVTVTAAIASGTSSVDFALIEVACGSNNIVAITTGIADSFSSNPAASSAAAGASGDFAVGTFTGSGSNTGWDNPPTGWTTAVNNTPGPQYVNGCYQEIGSSGTVSVSWGTLTSAADWAAAVVVYRQYVPPAAYDRIVVGSTTTGTSDFVLGSAVDASFQGTGGLVDGARYAYIADLSTNVEMGQGVWTAGTNTLTRNPIFSTNSNAKVSWAAGTKRVRITAAADQLGAKVTVYNANGTHTFRVFSTLFEARCWGGGGGGGSGSCWTSNQSAGGGGSGGGYATLRGRIADITTSVTITVGGGGSGGTAVNGTIGQDGADGSAGGNSSFGTYCIAYGGGGSAGGINSSGAGGGSGGGAGYRGAGGNATTATGGSAGAGGGVAGVTGNTGVSNAPAGNIAQTLFGGASGGAGGGINNSPQGVGGTGGAAAYGGGGGGGGGARYTTNSAGGPGGATATLAGGAAGAADGGNGSPGNDSLFAAGSGGGGGGGSNTGSTGNGGAGGVPGGGGGGGGGVNSSATGSVGGAGGAGRVIVWEA